MNNIEKQTCFECLWRWPHAIVCHQNHEHNHPILLVNPNLFFHILCEVTFCPNNWTMFNNLNQTCVRRWKCQHYGDQVSKITSSSTLFQTITDYFFLYFIPSHHRLHIPVLHFRPPQIHLFPIFRLLIPVFSIGMKSEAQTVKDKSILWHTSIFSAIGNKLHKAGGTH